MYPINHITQVGHDYIPHKCLAKLANEKLLQLTNVFIYFCKSEVRTNRRRWKLVMKIGGKISSHSRTYVLQFLLFLLGQTVFSQLFQFLRIFYFNVGSPFEKVLNLRHHPRLRLHFLLQTFQLRLQLALNVCKEYKEVSADKYGQQTQGRHTSMVKLTQGRQFIHCETNYMHLDAHQD